jgi:D-3-phosphoglycerate dehydrogenase
MRILLMSAIDPATLAALRAEHDVTLAVGCDERALADHMRSTEIAILRSGTSLTGPLIAAAPHLQLVIRAGSGTDNIDLTALHRRGIRLERIAEPGARAVAEMAVALMLALTRHVVEADRDLRQGRWTKTDHVGHRLSGKTLGIVGAGNIGTRLGAVCRLLGMDVIGCVEHPGPHARHVLAAHGMVLAGLDEVLTQSDIVSLHVPLTPRTRGLIGREALSSMRPGAYLVDLARGGVLDELALRDALRSGHLAGAALDVHEREGEPFASPLADLPNVVLTPHIGAGTVESQREIGDRLLAIVRAAHDRADALGDELAGSVVA